MYIIDIIDIDLYCQTLAFIPGRTGFLVSLQHPTAALMLAELNDGQIGDS